MTDIIRVIDLETTGFVLPEAEVCEIGYVDVNINQKKICEMGRYFVKPERPIPPQTSAIHHIIDDDVKDSLPREGVSNKVFPDDCENSPVALAAHNAKFEKQFCTDDITLGAKWICTYKCGLRLFPDSPTHSNQGLRYYLNPQGIDRALASDTHRALPDAYVTAFLLIEMLELASLDDLIKWSSEPALQVTCHIGKQRGTKWCDVDRSFLQWVASRDFDEDVIFTVNTELERRYGSNA